VREEQRAARLTLGGQEPGVQALAVERLEREVLELQAFVARRHAAGLAGEPDQLGLARGEQHAGAKVARCERDQQQAHEPAGSELRVHRGRLDELANPRSAQYALTP